MLKDGSSSVCHTSLILISLELSYHACTLCCVHYVKKWRLTIHIKFFFGCSNFSYCRYCQNYVLWYQRSIIVSDAYFTSPLRAQNIDPCSDSLSLRCNGSDKKRCDLMQQEKCFGFLFCLIYLFRLSVIYFLSLDLGWKINQINFVA